MKWWFHGDPLGGRKPKPPHCTAEGCTDPIHAKGLCNKHRQRLATHGDVNVVLPFVDFTPEEKYEAQIDRRAGPDACHPWTGTTADGYGVLWVSAKLAKAHRFGWQLAEGPIPAGLKVCHSCDNPPCQNRRHWFLGTSADNTADMVAKGRQAKGERSGQAKLTDAQVQEIRRRSTGRWGEQTALAKEYGVSQSHISCILLGKIRRSV